MDEEKSDNLYESVSMQVDPLANYCPHCDSNEAINPLASYMPFVDLRFRIGMIGKLWRKTRSSGTPIGCRILYSCILLLFFPVFYLIMFPVSIAYKHLCRKNKL
ncbi:MAG: hypothetical protein ACYSU8_05455 [Planctomycetota bacterium]|jgi:hypothetical protein